MYTKTIPFKDLYGKPQNKLVHFHLFEHEVMDLLVEFKAVFDWLKSIESVDRRELPTEDVVEFFKNLKEILLASYGTPSEDGLSFDHDDRYNFEKTALFNAVMLMFVTDPQEAIKLVEALMPKDFEELAKKAEANLEKVGAETKDEKLQAEIASLRAQLSAAQSGS